MIKNALVKAAEDFLKELETEIDPAMIEQAREIFEEFNIRDPDMQNDGMIMVLLRMAMDAVSSRSFGGEQDIDEELFLDHLRDLVDPDEDLYDEELHDFLDSLEEDTDTPFSKQDPPEDLEEVLWAAPDEETLEDLAAVMKYDLYEGRKGLAERMLSKEVLQENLLVLHDKAVEQLDTLISGGAIPVSELGEVDIRDEWGPFVEYGWFDEDGYFRITQDVRDALAVVDNQEFSDRRDRMTWLYDCTYAFGYTYGVGPTKLLLKMYNSSSVHHLDSEKGLIEMMKQMPESRRVLHKCKAGYCLEAAYRNKDFMQDLLDFHRDEPVPVELSRAQIAILGEFGYPADSPYYRALGEHAAKLALNTMLVSDYLTTVYRLMSLHVGHEDLLDLNEPYMLSADTPEEMHELALLFVLVNNHTGKMYLNGKTPEQTKAEGNPKLTYTDLAVAPQVKENNRRLHEKYKDLEQELPEEEPDTRKS